METLSGQSPGPSESLTMETLRGHSPGPSESLTMDEVSTQQLQASFPSKQHTPGLMSSNQPGQRRMADLLFPLRQMDRQPLYMISDKRPAHTRLEDLSEEEGEGLSPGLSYLQQVCQMLEEIAKQKMHNRSLKMEMDALQKHQDMEVDQADSRSPEEISSCQSLENKESAEHNSSSPRSRKDCQRHFRQRSASNPAITTLRSRELNVDHRGQCRSTEDLLDVEEEGQTKKVPKVKERNKVAKNWTFRMRPVFRAHSQQMQSSEKTSARQRLNLMFKRSRRKTLSE
ncbi:uncharacterized protein si:dkey-106l3.7 [Brachionichthys hirsutus]|uniref:uncharacterized protein si:dkey-106l3.7 n=1 Tax=Brachionichthys hirsutus TaxID=412623 RepID=UPI003604FB80